MCKTLLKKPSDIWEGYEKGEQCNRDVTDGLIRKYCKGIIDEHESDNSCSCHLGHPPCSYCVDSRLYCPECDWDGYEEQYYG